MSAIAANASITLITGVPGNGKTLRAVWYIREAVKAGEQVYVCNLNGLNIDGAMPFEDPWKWEELPAGSILVVDEAQKFWRAGVTETVNDARTGKPEKIVPRNIQAMETIRHVGIRLIILTQSPSLIHLNIRQLVGLHEHLVRENGKQLATVYRASKVIDNVRSPRALLAEDHESWAFPADCYGLYKSAEVHTVKRTISSKMKRGLMLACVAAALLGYAYWNGKNLFGKKDEPQAGAAAAPAQAGAMAATGAPAKDGSVVKYDSPLAYAKAHLPRFNSMPWTAEVYDQRPTTADPQLFCMSSMPSAEEGGEPSCTCLTEQGTRYEMSQPECRRVARHGLPYNPYKERRQDQLMPATPAPALAQAQAQGGALNGAVVNGDFTKVGETSNVVNAPAPHF
jgi:zona occludens toxin